MINNVDKKGKSLGTDLSQLLMNSSKELVIPNKVIANSFSQKLYSHIISIYGKNNFYAVKTSLPSLQNLIKTTRNAL